MALASGGLLPQGADGKPLNTDFETGTLQDWTAEGKAFDKADQNSDTFVTFTELDVYRRAVPAGD